jgi:diguanylate cyclase (GGDEF)-like protein
MSNTTQQIDLLCAQQLFKSSLTANISMIAGAIVSTAYFYHDNKLLIIWIISMCLIASARILISQKFFLDQKNNFSKHPVSFWVNTYTASSLASGSGWASLIFFLPATIDPVTISVIYIIFFAIMAATITALPVVLPAYFAYTTPIFLSALSFSFFITSRYTIYISIASVIYFSLIISAGRILNNRYKQNFSLLIENEKLISKLHDEIVHKELAQQKSIINQQVLEETVKQRTKELSDINKTLLNEISERRRIESNLKHMAHHDNLTNLPNRLLLDARLEHAIERAKRSHLQVAVIFIDLDHFKTINDSLGHAAGDELLVTVSKRLLKCIREGDTVARLGGDEFIIIIEQLHDIGDLDPLLKKIMEATSETISIKNHDLVTSASMGISIYPDDGDNAEKLMRNADAAMYYVKENGRHKYHFYSRELTTAVYDHVILEADLKHAIKKNQLLVYYQPQVSLQTKKIVGAEALARWQHPELGILPPKQFLKAAEQYNLINQIGKIVLTTACRQIVSWKKQGIPIKSIAVNISGSQIHQTDLVKTVKNVLRETNCKTDWLELEISEDFIINKTNQAITTLRQLRDLGISLAIDDFGTGYSSLSHLKQLPVNKLKIDRCFVRDLNDDMEDAALVQAIIAMGKSLQLETVAEGVENSSHEIFLSAHGCDYAQGYYYSKPLPAQEVEKLFADKPKQRQNVTPIRKISD